MKKKEKAAAFEPRIVRLLRILHWRKHVDPSLVETAFAKLDEIFSVWEESGNLSHLCNALGVSARPGRLHTRVTVEKSRDIVRSLILAARRGSKVNTYGKAAALLSAQAKDGRDINEKRIERLWNEFGEQETRELRMTASAGNREKLREFFPAGSMWKDEWTEPQLSAWQRDDEKWPELAKAAAATLARLPKVPDNK